MMAGFCSPGAGWRGLGCLLPLQCSERFSSSDLVGLNDVDGFSELPDSPGAAAQLAQDVPGLELGVGPLARGAQASVSAVGGFLRGRLVPPPVRGDHRLTSTDVSLVRQGD